MESTEYKKLYSPRSIIPEIDDDQSLKVLLLDDDPVFLNFFKSKAKKKGIVVSTCTASSDFFMKNKYGSYDVAVIDFNLDEKKSGRDVAAILEKTPVILVSENNSFKKDTKSWPQSIRAFINKKYGIDKIIDTTIKLCWKSK